MRGMITSVTTRWMGPPCCSMMRQRLRAVDRGQHLIAVRAQDVADELAHVAVVFDQEHRLGAARAGVLVEREAAGRSRRRVDARQEDAEGGALADGAVDDDLPARLRDDAVHRRQPEAGALARLLGREERLEDARARRVVDARAGVAHREHDPAADWHAGVVRRGRVLDVDVLGGDGEHAARRHGVARVDDQVDHDLLELSGVGAHRAEALAPASYAARRARR